MSDGLSTTSKVKSICLIGVLLGSALALGQTRSSSKIFGAYQFCPFPCITIRINRNHTFEYVLDGDLYNNQRTRGRWEFAGKGKIKAKSYAKPLRIQVNEVKLAERAELKIQAISVNGEIISGLKVTAARGSVAFAVTTDDNGYAMIPRCTEFELEFDRRRVSYEVKSKETGSLRIVVIPDSDPIVDDVWLIEAGMLYVVDVDGKIDRSSAYRKLSLKQERRIFH